MSENFQPLFSLAELHASWLQAAICQACHFGLLPVFLVSSIHSRLQKASNYLFTLIIVQDSIWSQVLPFWGSEVPVLTLLGESAFLKNAFSSPPLCVLWLPWQGRGEQKKTGSSLGCLILSHNLFHLENQNLLHSPSRTKRASTQARTHRPCFCGKYRAGQKGCSGFSIRSHGKTQTNFWPT